MPHHSSRAHRRRRPATRMARPTASCAWSSATRSTGRSWMRCSGGSSSLRSTAHHGRSEHETRKLPLLHDHRRAGANRPSRCSISSSISCCRSHSPTTPAARPAAVHPRTMAGICLPGPADRAALCTGGLEARTPCRARSSSSSACCNWSRPRCSFRSRAAASPAGLLIAAALCVLLGSVLWPKRLPSPGTQTGTGFVR